MGGLEREVHSLRRSYDKIMQEKKSAVSKLANLQDAVKVRGRGGGGRRSRRGGEAGHPPATSTTALVLAKGSPPLNPMLVKSPPPSPSCWPRAPPLTLMLAQGPPPHPHAGQLAYCVL